MTECGLFRITGKRQTRTPAFTGEVLAYLESRTEKRSDSGCWEWLRARNEFGYGIQRQFGPDARVHRLGYAVLVGPVPQKTFVLHRCDNPPCWNPDHLYLGGYAENYLDVLVRNRRRDKATLSKESVARALEMRNSGALLREIAEELDSSISVIHRRVHEGDYWWRRNPS